MLYEEKQTIACRIVIQHNIQHTTKLDTKQGTKHDTKYISKSCHLLVAGYVARKGIKMTPCPSCK